jgi:imidazolonepropionase-like amidohydrolase
MGLIVVLFLALIPLFAGTLAAQRPDSLGEEVRKYVAVDTVALALTNALLIDGTGSEPKPDQTVLIRNGRIQAVGPAAQVRVPSGVRTMDLKGHTLIPGLVGMHDHLF